MERIIAKQGPADRYLVLVGDADDPLAIGRVLDLGAGVYFPAMVPAMSIVRQGYWEPYEPEPGELDRLLAQLPQGGTAAAPRD